MDDPAVDAFTHAHRDHRIRGAFHLLGALGSLAIAFVQSLDGLISYHDARYIIVPIPGLTGLLFGELVLRLRRLQRARHRIPVARIVLR